MLDMQFNAAHLCGDRMTDEVQRAKGRLRVAYRFHPDQVEKLQGELAEKNIAAAIKKVLAKAPPLTEEQRVRLAELLTSVRISPNGDDVDGGVHRRRLD